MPELQIPLPIGALLRERYVIKSVLVTGGTGTIYLAKDQQAKNIKYQLFALKEISDLDQQARYQFTFSGTALRQLQHPVLPHIHHIFNDDKRNCVYLVMDYVEGTSLEALRLQRPSQHLSWSELRPICEPLTSALTYLHLQEKPFFHGDLAPTNIIQSITGKIMFLDLGHMQAGMRQTSLASSTSYRAPEQFTGELNELSDVYGLGAMLYALLTGQEPVDALTRLEQINKKRADPLPLASKIAPDVHRPLAEALHKALALDPAERFGSIKAFWEVLRTLPLIDIEATPVASRQNAQTANATSPIPSENGGSASSTSATRHEKRHILLPALTLLCALLLLLAGLGTWAWASAHSNPTAPGFNKQVTTTASVSTPLPGNGQYIYMPGTYKGTFGTPSSGNLVLTIIITKQQNQGQFSGKMISSQINGNINGTIDLADDVQWIVTDASGNTVLEFSGILNGIGSTKNDSMGGSFFRCVPQKNGTCPEDSTPNTGGLWTVDYFSASVSL